VHNRRTKETRVVSSDLRTNRTTLGRHAERGSHDPDVVRRILDEGLVCHVGFVSEGQPYVIPASYGRIGDALYLHGSVASRMCRALAAGAPVCVTVTLLDGIVLARSAFHHSVNYRSVVVLGCATAVTAPEEKLAALRAISEQLLRGRWDEVRPPSAPELAATAVLKLVVSEASAKIRSGPPADPAKEEASPVWAGVLPLALTAGEPVPDGPTAANARDLPESLRGRSSR
jgi:uncharacterized protein